MNTVLESLTVALLLVGVVWAPAAAVAAREMASRCVRTARANSSMAAEAHFWTSALGP